MMIGMGTPRSQSKIPRPIRPSFGKIADINNRSPKIVPEELPHSLLDVPGRLA